MSSTEIESCMSYFANNMINQTKLYLDKFWLFEEEMYEVWIPLKDKIFKFPSLYEKERSCLDFFSSNFATYTITGGCLFSKKSYKNLTKIMKKMKEKYLIIIEDYLNPNAPPHTDGPALHFKIPVGLKWSNFYIKELQICEELIKRPVRNFFVFGDSGNWGKYIANDFEWPLEITGYSPELKKIFKKHFYFPKKYRKDLLSERSDCAEKIINEWNFLEKK
ncbi:hypothetical protein [Treponema zioleckii]|uniref:hypothetical protein n=1 Tax=Treponema zioleckii TaxID=331680 RepID=UPI00168AF6F6|nr:hypothetical protein [Treponema zioleckii]